MINLFLTVSLILGLGFCVIKLVEFIVDNSRVKSDFSILFYLYSNEIKLLYNNFLLKILFYLFLLSVCALNGLSKHFLVSLDIIFLFSILLIIFINTFKISREPSIG